MARTHSFKQTAYLARLAALTAVTLIMAFTPLGILPIPGLALELALITIPVAVGAIVLGPLAGAFLGLIFGVSSFLTCLGIPYLSQFGSILFGINPAATVFICIVPRILEGWLAGMFFKALKGKRSNPPLYTYPVAALSTALLNTLFFMAGLLIFFWGTEFIQGIAEGQNILAFFVMMVGLNGAVEILLCAVLGGAIARALRINNKF